MRCLCLVATLFFISCNQSNENQSNIEPINSEYVLVSESIDTDFETVEKSNYSTLNFDSSGGIRVCNDMLSFKTVYSNLIGNETKLITPNINFSKYSVFILIDEVRPTAGYSVSITSLSQTNQKCKVEWDSEEPDKDDVVAQFMTKPYHIIKVKRK